jgi:hypothetical protein
MSARASATMSQTPCFMVEAFSPSQSAAFTPPRTAPTSTGRSFSDLNAA